MKARFFDLAQGLGGELRKGETLLSYFSGERSDFVRFNRARVRQAGTVEQRYLGIRLIGDSRQASARIALTGAADDVDDAREMLRSLRQTLTQLPEDPWLLISLEPMSTSCQLRWPSEFAKPRQMVPPA